MTTYGQDFSVEMGAVYERNYKNKGLKNWWTGEDWKAQDFSVSVDKLIADMDRAGVDKACIMGYCMPHLKNYKPDLAEYMQSCMRAHPGRIFGFISVDPLGGVNAVRLIEDSIKNKKLTGVKMMPGYSNVAINDRRLWPIYEICEELGVPLIVHTGHSSLPSSLSHIYNNPLFAEEVAFAFPKLRMIAAHTGMHWPEDGLTLLLRYENVYGDFAFWGTMPFFKAAETLVWAKQLGVLHKIMWGSDYPEYDFAPEIARYRTLPEYTARHELEPCLTEEDIDGFLGNNAARLLGLA
jgi:predicted TIM-barrel fold metal-dependent hydrolase